MKALTRAAVIGGLLLLTRHPCSGQENTSGRAIGFSLSDCWGNTITPASITITRLEPVTTYQRLTYPSQTGTRLEPGQYNVLIEARGFFSSSSTIWLGNDDLEIRTCLTLAPVEGVTRPKAAIRGTISGNIGGKNDMLWVRLVGVYNDTNRTVRVDTAGHFSFAGIQPGRYLILLFDQSGVKDTKQTDIREPLVSITIP
jgi:hypothetical protein